MYAELVKALHYCGSEDRCKGCPRENAKTKCYDDICIEAADAIEELSMRLHGDEAAIAGMKREIERMVVSGNKPRWIPVEERLPETGEIVLVYGKRGGIYTAEHNRSARWPGTFWKLNSKSHHCEPTHWMPLPEPPKEEE